MQPADGEALCSPGQSLWSLIREHVSESQLPKIHTALGPSLVYRYTEAYAETEMWHKMLQDTQRGICSRTGTPLPGRQRLPLADPPAVKELVRAEVHMLLQTLRERAGRNGEELLSLYKPQTVSYALGHAPRCHSSLSEDTDPRSVSRLSIRSVAEEEIGAVRENLITNDLEQVVDRLRSLFIEECEALKQEIKQLRRNIWRKSRQDLEPTEPTLGDLKQLRDAVQKDLAHYIVPVTSSVKELKSTHRLAAAASHQPVSSVSSVTNDLPRSNPTQFFQPKPPNGLPPFRTSNSSKPGGISSPSKTKLCTFSTLERKKTALSQGSELHSTSPTKSSFSQMRHHDDNPSQRGNSPLCAIPTNSYSFPLKPQKNSASNKTHITSRSSITNKAEESNLSQQMGRKQSVGHGSRNTNIPSSAISPSSYEHNKGSESNDCPGERPKTPNGLQNTASGRTLLTTKHDGTDKSIGTPLYECRIGTTKGYNKDMETNRSHHREGTGALHTKPKTHFHTTSPKTVLKVSVSDTQKEKSERTEVEYLNRFVQPVPPSRVK